MANEASILSWEPKHLRQDSQSETRDALVTSVLPPLLDAISDIGKALRRSHQVALAGTANSFGDEQLNVDVEAENIIRAALATCPCVVTASSEEDPVEKAVVHDASTDSTASAGSPKFTVAFDPLDGSSIIASNWTVGTIIGIWSSESALGQDPREKQIAAVLGVYGPRTTAIIAVREPSSSQEPVCFEIGLDDGIQSAEVIREAIRLSSPPYKTTYFAPANLRAAAEDERYMGIVTNYISRQYTLRYSGGLVPDIVHALVKGHGIYVSPVTAASKAKLRRLYELCPVALIIECAGGRAVDPADGEDILAREIRNCDERAGLVCGNEDEVEAVRRALLG